MSEVSPSSAGKELLDAVHQERQNGEEYAAPRRLFSGSRLWPRRDSTAQGKPRVRRGIRFKITVEGFVLLLISLLVGFAAWHSGANLLYLLFSILVTTFLLHGFVLSINLTGLQASEQAPELVVAGQPFSITVSLENRKWRFSSSSISVTHYLENSRERLGGAHFVQVRAGSTSEETYEAVVPRRGYFKINRVAVTTRYPFGFEERGQVYETSREILALPETFPVSSTLLQTQLSFGDQESSVRGTGTDLYGLREYVQGEPARHVHWRTSARAQKLMLAEYTREERRQVYLVLDNAVGPDKPAAVEDAFEKAVTLTASLARHLVEMGFEVGLVTQSTVMSARQGGSHLTSILRHLALISLVDGVPLQPVRDAMHIIYREDDRVDKAERILAIDSRDWEPPAHGRMVGEKAV